MGKHRRKNRKIWTRNRLFRVVLVSILVKKLNLKRRNPRKRKKKNYQSKRDLVLISTQNRRKLRTKRRKMTLTPKSMKKKPKLPLIWNPRRRTIIIIQQDTNYY